MSELNRYERVVEWIFRRHYRPGVRELVFQRQEIADACRALDIPAPKNFGDVIYSFRYRAPLPKFIQDSAPAGQSWVIRPAGKAKYRFVLTGVSHIQPNPALAITKVPDATPGIIARYALSDEQALLAKLRYNRLLDVFTRVACYSLQNHLRTTVPGLGQVEVDEIYVGVDRQGAQYVLPVEAKGPGEVLSVVQVEQDMAVCQHKFPGLPCRPIAAQFMAGDVIALFELEMTDEGIRIALERHYRLVPPEEITPADLEGYAARSLGDG